MELIELYEKLLSEGCNHFYIEGIGGPFPSDVDCLYEYNGNWEICYTERGQKSEPIYSSPNKEEAIQYYYDHIMRMEHWHLVVFTRSYKIFKSYKDQLEGLGIRVIQNDIPAYSEKNDRVYRLFVVNKSIFKAKEKFENLPYFDPDIK
ncbi:MAG: hypothetical protein QM737_22870 [Ferruginibacter sp.]